MPSPFAAAVAAMDIALDTHMGESVLITPMRNGDFATAADTERAAFTVVALVNPIPAYSVDIAKLDARVSYEEVEVEIRRAVLPAGAVLRKNDEVTLSEWPGAPRYKIGSVETLDPQRITLKLSKIGAE